MRRGATLVELLIYCGLALLVSLAVASIFAFGRNAGLSAAFTYTLSRDLDTAVRGLREDFRGATIESVRVKQRPPGVVMQSAVSTKGGVAPTVNPFGVPAWQNDVYYFLDYKPGATTGNLVRWVRDNVSPLPAVPGLPVSPIASASTSRVVLRNVVVPGGSTPGGVADAKWGGFVVKFVRSYGDGSEELSDLSPSEYTHLGGDIGPLPPFPTPPPPGPRCEIQNVNGSLFDIRSVSGHFCHWIKNPPDWMSWAASMQSWWNAGHKGDAPVPPLALAQAFARTAPTSEWTAADRDLWQGYVKARGDWELAKQKWEDDQRTAREKALDGNTHLLQVQLTVLNGGTLSRANCTSLTFRVRCRY